MMYRILHLPSGTYIYRSVLDQNRSEFGQFYSEFESSIGGPERYINLYSDANILKSLMYEIHRMKNHYFSFRHNDPNSIDIAEHFILEEVDDE